MPQRLDQPYDTNPHCGVLTRRLPAILLLAVSTLGILVATLFASGETLPRGWSLAIASGEEALAEAIQNLLLFIPLGMALGLIGVRPLRAIALGAALSLSVEFIQQWLPGRDPSAGDIFLNTISTAIGAGLVRTATRWLTVAPRRAAWHALATALAAAVVWLGTGALLHPILPPPPYHAVWNPNFDHWGQYQGRVLSMSIGSLPLSEGPLPPLPNEQRGTEGVRVTAVAARRPPGRPSPLVAILDARHRPVVMVIVDRTDLGLSYATRAGALRLEQPDLRWRRALAPPRVAPGDTFTVHTWRGERGSCLGVGSARCGLGYTIGDGWKLIFYPEHFPGSALTLLNALWVGGWLLGVGYWAGRAGKNPAVYAAIGVAIVAIAFVPGIAGLKATPVVECMGGLAGIAGGYVAPGRYRGLQRRSR